MIDITIKRGSENLSGKWNGKFYYSDKKKLFRKIYINYEDKESQDIHLSQKEYLALLQTQEAFIKQEDIQIKLKIKSFNLLIFNTFYLDISNKLYNFF